MSDDARKLPKFPWDYDVPNDAFWISVPYPTARNFLSCYTPSQISNMHFDSTLSVQDKLKFLRQYLNTTLKEKEEEVAPTLLYEADNPAWMCLKLAMCGVENELGNYVEQEKLAREMYDRAPDMNKRMSVLHQLAGILMETGRYAEGETMAQQVLPWMQEHELLGKDSPQALSSVRTIATCIWKQRRYQEGGDWIDRYGMLVGSMSKGRFQKYQDSEMKMYVETKRILWEWRREHGHEDGEDVLV